MTNLSVIVPISERASELKRVNDGYLAAISAMGVPFEVVYVLDEQAEEVDEYLRDVVARNPQCRSIRLSRRFGSATALAVGLKETTGKNILILPPYAQVSANDLSSVVDELAGSDVVVAVRDRRADSRLNRAKSSVYNFMARRVSDTGIGDVTCDVRALRRYVAEELTLYGGLARFIPEQAHRLGFSVTGVEVAQARSDRRFQMYGPWRYFRRLLDVLAALLLLRFTVKPLRFFGAIGLILGSVGIGMAAYAIVEPLILGENLASRYLSVAAALVLMLALQIIAVGLVGETVVFGRGKRVPTYRIREVVTSGNAQPTTPPNAQSATG